MYKSLRSNEKEGPKKGKARRFLSHDDPITHISRKTQLRVGYVRAFEFLRPALTPASSTEPPTLRRACGLSVLASCCLLAAAIACLFNSYGCTYMHI